MSDPFVHLHVHSEYSFLDGYGQAGKCVDRAKLFNQAAIAITDHGNVSGHKKWYDACRLGGIKPLLGVEAYVVDDSTINSRGGQWHITLLAKNIEGYRNLLQLVTKAWNDGFYYKPRTDWNLLKQYSKGIVATSGCPSGRIGKGIIKEGWDEAKTVVEMRRQAALFEPGNYYVELSPWQFPEGVRMAEVVYRSALKAGLPMILTMDAHYPAPEDAHSHDVLLCIQTRAKFSDPDRMKFSQDDFCIHSGEEMAAKWFAIHRKNLPGRDEMIINTGKIAEEINFDFPESRLLNFPYDGDKEKRLYELCEQGMVRYGFVGKPVYETRLKYEFELILSKKFVDYFLIVSDMIIWAKENGILVGAARGSSCGSLVCYLTRITEVDPILHELMMERFIDVSRKDLPDIDIDFEADRRHEVKEYLARKYGQDKVANLSTYSTFKGKLCLQDIGRVFSDKIPWAVVEETKRLIVQRSSADSRFGYTIEDTFVNFDKAKKNLEKYPDLGLAKDLEGRVRQLGVHAAGVVVSDEPIWHFAAIYKTHTGERVISMDGADASSVGLLKIDVLGLTALSIAKGVLRRAKENYGVEIDINKLPLDDKTVYANFCKRYLCGIFQFEGESTRQVCRQVQPDTFRELVAVNALGRPGPLHSGSTTSYIERRFGREKIESLHPLLDEVTKDTYGLTLYQEQVMQIVRLMGKFDWSGIAAVRKMMSKKYGDEAFGTMRDKFVAGAESQGVSKETALLVWHNIATFGSYAFNKSHSVAYALMGYQLMWLKTYYPAEFYAEVLAREEDDAKRRKLLREYKASNKENRVEMVCVNKSEYGVVPEKNRLWLGFDSVVKFGPALTEKLLKNRPYKNYCDFRERAKIPEKQCDKLLKVGAFRNLDFKIISRQTDLFGAHLVESSGVDYKSPNDSDLREFCPLAVDDKVFVKWRGWLKPKVVGELRTITEIDDLTDRCDTLVIGSTDSSSGFNLKNKIEETVSRGGEWSAKEGEEDLTKDDYSFLNFNLEDDTDVIIIRISYKNYPQYKEMMWAIKPTDVVGVRGMVTGDIRMVFATHVVNLTEMGRRIRAKQPLTKIEQEFFKGKSRQFKRRFV